MRLKSILVLNVDGTFRELHKPPTWKEMQQMVGGWIEQTRVLDHIDQGKGYYTYMYVNEEGLLLDLPLNKEATRIYLQDKVMDANRWRARIVGPAIYWSGWTTKEIEKYWNREDKKGT